MQITVYHTISSDLAINQDDGVNLYNAIAQFPPTNLVISFANIKLISTAFLNESIGKYAQLYPNDIQLLNFEYPADNATLVYKIKDVIENALMGEEYSLLVDNALASL